MRDQDTAKLETAIGRATLWGIALVVAAIVAMIPFLVTR